jgi:hypothetical protein
MRDAQDGMAASPPVRADRVGAPRSVFAFGRLVALNDDKTACAVVSTLFPARGGVGSDLAALAVLQAARGTSSRLLRATEHLVRSLDGLRSRE